MNKTIEKAEKFIDKVSAVPVNVLVWALSFLGIIALRIFIEFFVASPALPAGQILIEYLHNFFFFLLTFLLIWLVLSLVLKANPVKLANLMLYASWLIILPPLLDMLRTGGKVFWSFYVLDGWKALGVQFATVFGRLPSGIVYFGTKITFILAIIFGAVLVYVKSKNLIRAALGAVLVYVVLFLMGSFPSWAAFLYYFFEGSKKIGEIQGFHIVQFFGTPAKLFGVEFNDLTYAFAYNLNLLYYPLLLLILAALFFSVSKSKFWAVLKNFRFPQIIYHTGLFLVGTGLGYLAYPENFHLNLFSVLAAGVLLGSVWLAWKTSVIVNDIYDLKIDEVSNPERPLPKGIFELPEYARLGAVVFLLSFLGGLVVGVKFAALLFIYQFLAWAYSARPMRIKKFPVVAALTSSAASLTVLFMGFALFSGDQNIQGLSWRIILLLLISYTLSLPVKDFKDIEGDKKERIWTIPVLFGEEKGRLIVAVGIFLSFILSVFFLNEFRLFWWAVLFGSASFLIVTSKKIKPRRLFWWLLGVVFVYGLVLVKIVFLK